MAGPPSPPERLLKASLLIALHSIRSERAFCEELDYHLVYRWFLDMSLLEPSFDATSFTNNRQLHQQLRAADGAGRRPAVLRCRRRPGGWPGLLSDTHFTVAGTLIEAAASLKSFKPMDGPRTEQPPDDPGNPSVNFRGERRCNATHQSTTNPEARLARKGNGKEAGLSYMAHALMENRHGLLVDLHVSQATGPPSGTRSRCCWTKPRT
jgi:transposase